MTEILMLRDILAKPPNRNHDTTSPGGECCPCTRNWRRGGLLHAGARREATIKRKGVVNRKSATWTIPADVSKNKKPHVVHLSAFALAVWDRAKFRAMGNMCLKAAMAVTCQKLR